MKIHNILISTIKDFDSHTTIHYYYTHRASERIYIDGMAAGEAGTKSILSKVEIDEIIAIGSDLQSYQTDPVHKVILRDGIDCFSADVNTMSDFDFFRYRMVQFLDGMDIEAADLYGRIPKDRQNELIARLRELFGDSLDTVFSRFTIEPNLWNQTLEQLGNIRQDELEWIKRYLYHCIDPSHRSHAKEQNKDILVSFIPISNIGFDQNSMKNIALLTSALKRADDEEVHLYVDMHGFSHEESYIFMSVLQALSDNPSNNTIIEEITSLSDIPKGFLYKISNARERYKVELLLSGINAFINYGKVDLIRNYWKDTEIENEYIDRFMYAMDAIDTGMSLCNIDELERGIILLRTIIQKDVSNTTSQEEESFILALRAGIINDYGRLVEENSNEINLLELIKWAFSKGFYQQTITIIESRFPQDMVKRGILYYAETEEEKLAYLKAMNSHYWDATQKDRYIFQNPAHYFIKYYGRFAMNYKAGIANKNMEYTLVRADQVFGEEGDMLKAHSLIDNREDFISILYAYYDICGLRNTINHAVKNEPMDLESINYTMISPYKRLYRDNLNKFIRQYMDVCRSISEKEFSNVLISAAELDEYTNTHGPRDDAECFQAAGYIRNRDRKKTKKAPAEDAGQI